MPSAFAVTLCDCLGTNAIPLTGASMQFRPGPGVLVPIMQIRRSNTKHPKLTQTASILSQ